MALTLIERKIVRLTAADCSSTQSITVEDGHAAPYWTGKSYYYTTPGGRPIAHPNAYRWSKVYHGSTLTLRVGLDWVREKRTPKGMEWRADANGVYLCRLSDGIDYHPTHEDVRAKNFAGRVRRGMAANYRARVETRKAERVLTRSLPTIVVTLDDSRRAGNCVQGTLAWAERKLRLSRESVVAAGYVAHVPASTVLAAAASNGSEREARRAIAMAEQRLTLVQI